MARPAPLLIADIPWLLYRSYFALPRSIVDTEKRPINALLGTVNALLGLIGPEGTIEVRAVAACMGAEEAAYRVELYPPYHAHRDPMPEDLRRQWELAGALLSSLGFHFAESDELEADDVMFSYSRLEQEAGGEALLLTADRDLYGAVGERIQFVELTKGGGHALLDAAEVRSRYGIGPELVPDLIALRGDPSDGIPGAPGIGAKTAATLLQDHGSLEGVIAAAAKPGALKPRIAGAVADNAEQLLAFKQLATLQRVDVEPIADTAIDFSSGAAKAQELGMARLSERLMKLGER